ncbi:MinD/ParA family ATP-binding protein [Nocardia sp. IBHARD005]|uniref:MinD/ParA family ATP-binding protein n=1 Tax=Nocardia sp. IBHARD005 TaxID=3457765 RepID=UPI00405831CA
MTDQNLRTPVTAGPVQRIPIAIWAIDNQWLRLVEQPGTAPEPESAAGVEPGGDESAASVEPGDAESAADGEAVDAGPSAATPLREDYTVAIVAPDIRCGATASALVLGHLLAADRDIVLSGSDLDELDRRLYLPSPEMSPKLADPTLSGDPFAHDEPHPVVVLADWPVDLEDAASAEILDRADALVIPMTPDRDCADRAADLIEQLAGRDSGDTRPEHVMVVVSHTEPNRRGFDVRAASDYFLERGVCLVAEIPHDQHLAADQLIDPDRLAPRTVRAFRTLAEHLADSFATHSRTRSTQAGPVDSTNPDEGA